MERFIAQADLTTVFAFVDRLSAREVLLTFRGRSAVCNASHQQQAWLRQVLPTVEDLVTEWDAWTDPELPYEAHILLRFGVRFRSQQPDNRLH